MKSLCIIFFKRTQAYWIYKFNFVTVHFTSTGQEAACYTVFLHFDHKQVFRKHAWSSPHTFAPKHFILVKSYNLNGQTLPMQCCSLEANTEKQSLHLQSSRVLQRPGNKSPALLAVLSRAFFSFPKQHHQLFWEINAEDLLQTQRTRDVCKYNNKNKPHVCFFKDCHVPDIN